MKIELRGVLKTYHSIRALDRVSLEIEPGQIVSLLGRIAAAGFDFIKTENLHTFDGQISYSVGSGE